MSTLVQSGAALVAIIAGLLIARLVALVGERVTLERRVKELDEVRAECQRDFSNASQALLDDNVEYFLDGIFDRYFNNFDKPFEWFYEDFGYESRTAEELRPYFDRFSEHSMELLRQLGVAELAKQAIPSDWDDRRSELLGTLRTQRDKRIAAKWLDLVERVWRERRRPWAGPSIDYSWLASSVMDNEIRAARMTIDSDRRRDLQRHEADAELALKVAGLDLAHARQALDSLSRPEGLGTALVVLAGVAVGGIVLPLLQMTFGSPSLSMSLRGMYVGLFLASLAIFFAYLGLEMRRIMRRPK